jgi:methylenetetrahydrofolate reductase (NADPH)
MKVVDILNKNDFSASFEFFPPKTEEASLKLYNSIKELLVLKPAHVSVTYGAGGTTQQLTKDLLLKLQKETELCLVSHLTCVGHTKEEIHALLEDYQQAGIENLMVLRGDPPKGQEKFEKTEGGFQYASELLAYIKKHFPQFGCGVAGYPEGHPETPNRLTEMEHLKQKVDQGADYICTQLFFDNHDFYDFKERCEVAGINVPIIAGVMPITSIKGLKRMAELSGGTNFPAKLLKAIQRADSDEGVERVGIHWATEQVRDLIDNNVKGVHFYTLNQSKATTEIYKSLGIKNSQSIGSGSFFSL